MPIILQEHSEQTSPLQLAEMALGIRPLRAVRQGLSESGNAVYRLYLQNGESAVLRTSDRPNPFAFTGRNLDALRTLGLPVQSVIAEGPTQAGGSYIILNWLPGRDLVHELARLTRAQITRLAERVVEDQRRVGRLPQAARFGWAPIGRNGNLDRWTHLLAIRQRHPQLMTEHRSAVYARVFAHCGAAWNRISRPSNPLRSWMI